MKCDDGECVANGNQNTRNENRLGEIAVRGNRKKQTYNEKSLKINRRQSKKGEKRKAQMCSDEMERQWKKYSDI